ncbi:hypothetical protein GFL80_14155 [Rhizobium leguminosarum bv. viciae]|nr:hypothetical protein [Rhizobium leguminosarum bv. viciae]NKK85384.1 hypothetical protein [Rhizobium leguminosarum bv. viciae]
MRISIHARRLGAVAIALALASCTTTQADFYKKPEAVSKAALCRALVETQDAGFYHGLLGEVARRGIDPQECYKMVQQQNQAAVGLAAIALIGTAVAVCANNNCGGGYAPSRRYPGNCQYDWQYDAAGHRCGGRSATSRPGGW